MQSGVSSVSSPCPRKTSDSSLNATRATNVVSAIKSDAKLQQKFAMPTTTTTTPEAQQLPPDVAVYVLSRSMSFEEYEYICAPYSSSSGARFPAISACTTVHHVTVQGLPSTEEIAEK